MHPVFGQQHLRGVRGVLQHVVVAVALAAFDLRDLFAYGDHGVDETVELGQALGLGGFDHQRAGHREAHGGRIETVVHTALGDVFGADAAAVFQRAHIHAAFVRNADNWAV